MTKSRKRPVGDKHAVPPDDYVEDPKAERRVIDWEAIEREYRAGQLSVSEIARQHSVSHPLIFRKAKQQGWKRNLAARIKEEVTTRSVTDGVTAVTQREIIELAAERGVQIVRDHRALIGRSRTLTDRLIGELEVSDDMGLKDKSVTLGNLTTSLKTLVGLERQAFNLENGPADVAQGGFERIERVIVDPATD